MKKIPTLFKRVYDKNGKMTGVTEEATEGLGWVLEGKVPVVARVKVDGACCAVINGEFYRRYDANVKKNRVPPEGSIPCQDAPDEITGSWPHWVKCDRDNPDDKWFWAAYDYKIPKEYVQAFTVSPESLITPELSFNSQNFMKINNPYYLDATYEAIGKHFQGDPYGFDNFDMLVRHNASSLIIHELTSQPLDFMAIRNYLLNTHIEGIVFWDDKKDEPICKIKRTDFGFKWS